MHSIWRFALFTGILLLSGGVASAQRMTIPQWQSDRHVYTVPEGWQAPFFGPDDYRRIEDELRSLRFPFYVIISSELRDTDGNVAVEMADAVAQRWAETAPGYDVATSQVFVLAFPARKYGFLAGKRFTTTGGIHPDELIPHNRLFEAAMQGTPKDPRSGIVALAKSFDAFLVDRTDPVRIAARAEATRLAAARRAEEQRLATERQRLTDARGNLDSGILELSKLLASSRTVLPADTSSYRDLLAKAKQVRAKDDPAEMSTFAASMKPSVATLRDHVAEQKSRILGERMRISLIVVGIFTALIFVIGFIITRHRELRRLRQRFTSTANHVDEMVANASVRYVTFNDRRDAVMAIGERHGSTKQLFDAVSEEVDAIFAAVQAVKRHVSRCRIEAAKAGFWNLEPLRKGARNLNGTISFDTELMDEGMLFGSETKVITVDLNTFTNDLERRYKAFIGGWNRLIAATDQVGKTAKELFPHAKLDELMATADKAGIPRRWLHDHPLYGDDAADEAVYADLDALNQSDPVAFSHGIDALRKKEDEVAGRIEGILDLMRLLDKERSSEPPSTYGSHVDPGDDPVATFKDAVQEDMAFKMLLTSSDTLGELTRQAHKAVHRYQTAMAQSLFIKNAVAKLESDLVTMREECAAAAREQSACQQRMLAAQRVHSNLATANAFAKGQASLKEAQNAVSGATLANGAHRLLTASRRAKEATSAATAARKHFAATIATCDAADEKRAAYLDAVNNMGALRENVMHHITRYGGGANLSTFSPPRISGPADYVALTASLVTVRESWELAERKARQRHEAEQRRKREAEERRRREAAAAAAALAAAARRRSSSSSGGFGGGSSFGRGGGFGGGGSSGRGGSF